MIMAKTVQAILLFSFICIDCVEVFVIQVNILCPYQSTLGPHVAYEAKNSHVH